MVKPCVLCICACVFLTREREYYYATSFPYQLYSIWMRNQKDWIHVEIPCYTSILTILIIYQNLIFPNNHGFQKKIAKQRLSCQLVLYRKEYKTIGCHLYSVLKVIWRDNVLLQMTEGSIHFHSNNLTAGTVKVSLHIPQQHKLCKISWQ